MGGSAADSVMGGSAADTVMGGSAADTVMGGSAADTVMGGDLLLEGHRLCNTLVWGQQFYTTCVAVQCCQITAPIIPTCPSMMGVVVLQQLQGQIDR